MPPAPCPAKTWRGRGAEEILHFKERKVSREDPDYVACPRFGNNQLLLSASTSRPHKESSEFEEADQVESELQEDESFEDFVPTRSCSAPALKPLTAPHSMDISPFASTLGFLRREPSEFQLQRDMAARREAAKLMRKVYRSSIEAMGYKFREDQPWPPKEKKREHLPVKGQVSPLLRKQPEPKPWCSPMPKKSLHNSSKRSASQSNGLSCLTEREETLRDMKSFGRGCVGGPYTIGQVYQEVDADVQHRFPADVRALSGRLGPTILGRSTTRMRRKLPFTHPWMTTSGLDARSTASTFRPEVSWR
eukprot:TRINITY_DN6837_c0_g1_i1.p1 TRINITY_DN6837_c0_g1~~TRINITY_DN6837_c0_g1_i1.p1  ORF type:complete len:306 (+),score=49.51 TRINITY_DN6837_c0_g1_i1:113-1030(+)